MSFIYNYIYFIVKESSFNGTDYDNYLKTTCTTMLKHIPTNKTTVLTTYCFVFLYHFKFMYIYLFINITSIIHLNFRIFKKSIVLTKVICIKVLLNLWYC